jgi:transcriptional regulator with XRE-family HTH domain
MESLKRARNARGLSLRELEQRSGIDRTALARAERPGYDPRATTLEAIARGLGVPVCELFGKSGHSPTSQERKTAKRKAVKRKDH